MNKSTAGFLAVVAGFFVTAVAWWFGGVGLGWDALPAFFVSVVAGVLAGPFVYNITADPDK